MIERKLLHARLTPFSILAFSYLLAVGLALFAPTMGFVPLYYGLLLLWMGGLFLFWLGGMLVRVVIGRRIPRRNPFADRNWYQGNFRWFLLVLAGR